MIFRILVALLFTAVIVGSFWLGGEQHETTATTTVENASGDLGYSAKDATLIETGTDGQPLYTLNADVVRQHPGDGAVGFEQVRMTFRDTNGQIWKSRADEGQLIADTGKVDLAGNVHVNGVLPGSAQMADLSTEKLAVDLHENIIRTAEPVTLNSPGRELKSKGMTAELKERHLVLESAVRGLFTP
jgi:LPS export ABC transporter protein LptC